MCAMCDRENSSHTGLRTLLATVVITVCVSVAHSATNHAEIAQAADILQLADSTGEADGSDLFAMPEDAVPPAGTPAAAAASGAHAGSIPSDAPNDSTATG